MLVENSGLESKKAPSANEELIKHENDRQFKFFQLAIFTTACYGASICRCPNDIKDLAHFITVSCSSQHDVNYSSLKEQFN